MTYKKPSLFKKILSVSFILIDLALVYFAFFYANINLEDKLSLIILLELSLTANIFIAYNTILEMKNYFKIFFKSTKSKVLFSLIVINIDFVIVSVVFAVLKNLFYLLCVVIPLIYLILILVMWKYCNYDSEKINTMSTNKYLGIGISNHYVFDGVDVLSEKNHKKADLKNIKMINPFNQIYSYNSENVYYVDGKDYKFYIATKKLNELYTLIFLVRNKDAARYFLNKHLKEDFELNKNIFTAYCLKENSKDEEFVYVRQNFRYKISKYYEKYNVQIEQKTELPHLNSQNGVSNWFGDTLSFASQEEANRFVKYVIKQSEQSALDTKF